MWRLLSSASLTDAFLQMRPVSVILTFSSGPKQVQVRLPTHKGVSHTMKCLVLSLTLEKYIVLAYSVMCCSRWLLSLRF